MTKIENPEFSFAITVAKLGADGIERGLEATPAQRAALARRFTIRRLDRLTAGLVLRPWGNAGWQLTGMLSAAGAQSCRVTMDPVPFDFEEPIDILLLPPAEVDAALGAVADDPYGPDIEPIEDGEVDLGELVAQGFAMALDPYPRRPDLVEVSEKAPDPLSPFAILRETKDKT